MYETGKQRHLLLKASIVLGVLLGGLLLFQTISTYRLVRTSMVRVEAKREADRRVQWLIASPRLAGERDATTFTPMIEEIVKGAPQQFAWVRILNYDGSLIAQAGKTQYARTYQPGELYQMLQRRDRDAEMLQTPGGPVLVEIDTIRMGPPPGLGPGRPVNLGAIEIAVYSDSVQRAFGPVRQRLIVGCLAALSLLAAVIVIGLRFQHYLRGKQVEEQLAMARRVQFDLLPAGSLLTRDMEFAARCVPAWHVGGDFYDAFETSEHQIALVLGDVSGKGVSAALLMGVVQGVVHASTGNHERNMEQLNHLLCMKTALERFVSLFWGYFDPARSVLSYINAGHLPPLLIRRKESCAFEVHHLDEGGGPVLGLLPGATYEQVEIPVLAGDLLVVYSDGILEAANVREEEFGEERILAAVEENWDGSPVQICDAVLAQVRAFLGKEPAHDDQTLMIVRLQQVPSAAARPGVLADALAS